MLEVYFKYFVTNFQIFPKISEDIQKCWKVVLSALRHFPIFSKDFRRLPKISKDFQKFWNLSECLFLHSLVL